MALARCVLVAALLTLLWGSVARADIAAPDPWTVFARGDEPTANTLVAIGLAISAVVVAIGLATARWVTASDTVRYVVGGIAAVVLLAVGAALTYAYWQAERDRAAWRQWDDNESSRRRNWRGQDFFRDRDPVPPSESTVPTVPAPPDTDLEAILNTPATEPTPGK